MTRIYRYTAIICRKGGTWVEYTGEFAREPRQFYHDGSPHPAAPGEIERTAERDARQWHPAAAHVFIQKVRLKK